MKSDTLTTVLNLFLALFAVCGVIFAILTFTYTREYRSITAQVNTANTIMWQMKGLLGELQEYNKTARSADLAGILQPYIQTAPAVPAAAPKPATR